MTDVSPEERRFYASVDTGFEESSVVRARNRGINAISAGLCGASPRRRALFGRFITQASSLDGRQSKALIEINRGPADLEIIGGARILPPSGALEKIHGIAIKRLS